MKKILLMILVSGIINSNILAAFHPVVRTRFFGSRHAPKHMHVKHTPPVKYHYHHRHHLTPYVIGALTGYALSRAIASPAPIVVQQPIVIKPTKTIIWEDGHYEDQVQANGTIIRIWVPGRYIERIVTP